MFAIELDIFSGRPNPRWTLDPAEDREFLTRLRDRAVPMAPIGSGHRLGYRGFVVRADGATAEALTAMRLPTAFRVRDGLGESIDWTAESWLLSTDQAERVPPVAAGAARTEITRPAGRDDDAAKACKLKLTSTTDLSKWNGQHCYFNNCYNFGSNSITDTYAQPGRGSGEMFHAITVPEIHDAAVRDGYLDDCRDSAKKRNLHVGFCIWPGADYHWYRQTKPMDGEPRWCHKMGTDIARNKDESGHYITNPETCDRSYYVVWGGFLWNPGKRNKVVR
jgi:hypothetical protein